MNEAALKARLKFIAQEKLKTFNEVWKQLLLERFLARLSRSTYREQFIFKGGLLLAQYMEPGLLNPVVLAEKLQATFKHRNTKFSIPIEFDNIEMIQLQNLWTNHLRGLGDIRKKLDLPDEISDLLSKVNSWLTNLQKTIDAMREAEHGQLKSFKTVNSLMDDLDDNSN